MAEPTLVSIQFDLRDLPRLAEAVAVARNIVSVRASRAEPGHPIITDNVLLHALHGELIKAARPRQENPMLTDPLERLDPDEPAPDLDPEQHFGNEHEQIYTVADIRRKAAEDRMGGLGMLRDRGDTRWVNAPLEIVLDVVEKVYAPDWPIPRYAMLDIWMALYGAEHSEGFEPFAEEHGFAETWARICAMVRKQREVTEPEPSAFSPDLHEWHDKIREEYRASHADEPYDDVEENRRGYELRKDAISELATMAEEPIEDRLRRAWLNGFKEGVERAAHSIEDWGRWDS